MKPNVVILVLGLAILGGKISGFAAEPLSKGVGPITEVKLDPLDAPLASKGKDLFVGKCSACHKMEERYVGPALKGVTTRRSPEWIMNMVMNPQEMTQKDPTAQQLLEEFLTQMPFQNVSKEETRAILEYFRHYDEKGEVSTESAATPTKESPPGAGKSKKGGAPAKKTQK